METALSTAPADGGFDWQRHPDAQAFVDDVVAQAVGRSARVAEFATRLATETSTRLQDWLDFVSAPASPSELEAVGYRAGFLTAADVWRHPGAQLPAIVIADDIELGLRVDDAAAFAQAQRSTVAVAGSPRAGFRRAVVSQENGVILTGVERRSWADGVTPRTFDAGEIANAAQAWRELAERPRARTGADGVRDQFAAARRAVDLVGRDLAAAYFLEQERAYWQRGNVAGQRQHARQDRLGLGWGNNDHHTFRSSRAAFAPLITFLTLLGFVPRERFYAGAEAGWGAQVLEHPGSGGVIFADVDLTSAEVAIDFSRMPLDDPAGPDANYGTVGMWCALHGESVLEAGMHHLEGQFEFESLRADLAADGVASMAPFSDFDHLRQAFTQAEVWPVDRARVEKLVANGHLTGDRGAEILAVGAAGSHLENLARRDGFKGFNQHNVSVTMRATHPRDYRPE